MKSCLNNFLFIPSLCSLSLGSFLASNCLFQEVTTQAEGRRRKICFLQCIIWHGRKREQTQKEPVDRRRWTRSSKEVAFWNSFRCASATWAFSTCVRFKQQQSKVRRKIHNTLNTISEFWVWPPRCVVDGSTWSCKLERNLFAPDAKGSLKRFPNHKGKISFFGMFWCWISQGTNILGKNYSLIESTTCSPRQRLEEFTKECFNIQKEIRFGEWASAFGATARKSCIARNPQGKNFWRARKESLWEAPNGEASLTFLHTLSGLSIMYLAHNSNAETLRMWFFLFFVTQLKTNPFLLKTGWSTFDVCSLQQGSSITFSNIMIICLKPKYCIMMVCFKQALCSKFANFCYPQDPLTYSLHVCRLGVKMTRLKVCLSFPPPLSNS